MFEIVVGRTFPAEHALHLNSEQIEAPHAHDWRCEVCLHSDTLDDAGCVIDFREVDAALDRAIEPIAGTALQEHPFFAGTSPSAENVAHYLYRCLNQSLAGGSAHIVRVTTWEDAEHGASYWE